MTVLRDLVIFLLAALLLGLIGAGAKVAVDSRAHFLEGEALATRAKRDGSRRDMEAASRAWVRAVESYVPFFSHGRPALGRIRQLGERLDRDGDGRAARRIWLEGARAAASQGLLYVPWAEETRELMALADRKASDEESVP